MNEIVKVTTVKFSEEEINAVDARELWSFLHSKQQFSNWITGRIENYGFTENIDFITINNSIYSPPRKEYTISLDMAKELSMVERNEKGREARKYFIECEKRLKEKKDPRIPRTMAEALQLAANHAKLIERQNEEIEQAKPNVEFVDNYVDNTGLFTLTALAKNLKFKRTDLIECLIRDKRIFRRSGNLEPYVTEVNAGRYHIKTGSGALGHAYSQLYVTPKGVEWIANRYASELGE